MTRTRIVILVLIVAAVAAIAGIRFYNARAVHQMGSQLYIPKQAHITPEIELLRQYVHIDTSNPPGRELPGAQFLAGLLEKNGVRAEIIQSAPGRAAVYARLKGRRNGEGLLLLNHIDVVPANPKQWTHPPFAGEIGLNQLWGRGSLDMKSIGICELEGFLQVARSGRQPERDLVFLAVPDEEQGGSLGTAWLVQHRPDIFQGIEYALNEGGVTETKAEQLRYFGIEIGTKMSVRARLRAPGRAQMDRVRIALEPYFTPPDPDRILPEVRLFFHEIAPERVEQRALLTNIDATIAAGKFWLLSQGFKELTQNVVWAGAVTTTPAGAFLDVHMYDLPDEDPNRRIAWLQSLIAPYGATIDQVLEKNGPAPLSSPDTPLYRLISEEAHREYGNVPVGPEILAASSNDSRFLRARGITCYGVWPFPVDFYQSLGIHGIDERIRLDWFMEGIGLMRSVVSTYASGS